MATKSKKTGGTMNGKALRASVGKALAKSAKPKAAKARMTESETGRPSTPVVEVVDVTKDVMGALEQQAKATKAKAKATKAKAVPPADADKVAKATAGGETIAAKIAANVAAQAKQDAEERAAIAVYSYAERLGIVATDVVRTATAAGEIESLVTEAGMEITDTVVWLASQKSREFDAKHVRPNSPKTRLPSPTSGEGAKAAKAEGTARVQVFGHSTTAVIRALRATCGMEFSQIRSVLDAMGAATVADGTIRAQMAGGGLTRGEPAPLTEKQIETAKEAAGLVTA